MNLLGLSAFYHESACCLLSDGGLVAGALEERFSRVKHDPRLPVEAFRFCLEAGGIGLGDLAAVAYYEEPVTKLSRQIWAHLEGRRRRAGPQEEHEDGSLEGGGAVTAVNASDTVRAADLPWLDPEAPERAIRERLGWDGPTLTYRHHLSHAASAYLYSGFPEAAILTVDGVGEWDTTTFGRGAGGRIEILEAVPFPHSLGLFYSAVTAYLGFRVNGGEYKVMGLAPYGRPRYAERLRRVVRTGSGGRFTLDLAYFDFLTGRRMYSDALCELLDGPPRRPGDEIEPRHMDVARSAQAVLEEV
ncbi:MAG TPA: carbamoyltransferase N-terminal domain-containing protein, partial [Thermoanaerobaculia bacterium]|nr:carbamoyltransferase N-terminal domain-containing protein [Thermoanaerobaculia bacterium]